MAEIDFSGLINCVDSHYEPRDPEQGKHLLEAVDKLLAKHSDIHDFNDAERLLSQESAAVLPQVAVKLARSKLLVRSIDQPLHVSLVFAVFKEHQRLLPPDQHPHGEDFLARKIEQLQWLFDDNAAVTWTMYIVDDGCPEGSGAKAQQILDARFPQAPVTVLYLQDAIEKRLPIAGDLESTAASQKGGSILYGMWAAAQEKYERHVIVFTDADLSVHLGQAGLMIDGIVAEGKDAAIASRREPNSVVVKTGHRNTRGKLFIYLWKGLIQPLSYITDTQCGFKAFTADTVSELFGDTSEKGFAFDIELLLKTEIRRSASICTVPIAWIDSEGASTTAGLQPYLPMLKSIVAMYRNYLPANPDANRLADMIESLSEAEWSYLTQNVPEAIANGEPTEFDRIRPASVDDLIAVVAGFPGP